MTPQVRIAILIVLGTGLLVVCGFFVWFLTLFR
jgi:hypothetical protein